MGSRRFFAKTMKLQASSGKITIGSLGKSTEKPPAAWTVAPPSLARFHGW